MRKATSGQPRRSVPLSSRVRRMDMRPEALERRALLSATFYVDPVNGVDTDNGTTVDLAVRTLGKAQALVRAANDSMTADITVNLLGGEHQVGTALSLTSADSGTNGYDVVWKAYNSTAPVVTGGERMTSGWSNTTVNGRNAWVRSLSATAYPKGLRNLYVGEERRPRAASEPVQAVGRATNSTGTTNGIVLDGLDYASFARPADLEVQQQVLWKHYVLPVSSIESTTTGKSILRVPEANTAENLSPDFVGFKTGDTIVLENAKELMDQPGEWYYDVTAGQLFYLPRAGETINATSIVVPKTERLLEIRGSSGTDRAHDIRFEGITFAYGGWASPNDTGWFGYDPGHIIRGDGRQGGVSFANVFADHAYNLAFNNNTFRNMGGTALHANRVTDVNIVGNLVRDASADGIAVGAVVDASGVQGRVNVNNNLVYRAGVEFRMTAGIITGKLLDSNVHHNHVRDVAYIGILVNKNFGTVPTTYGNVSVRYNLIENTMDGTFDGGAFYTWTNASNNSTRGTFSDNYVRGVYSTDSEAIYLDESASGWDVERNVMEGMRDKWYLIKGGNHNLRNNYTQDPDSRRTALFATPNIVEENTVVDTAANWSSYTTASTTVANAGLESAYSGLRSRVPAVPTTNAAPAVNAGPDRSVTLANRVRLDASATDDRAPYDALQTKWTKVSGPGEVNFFGVQNDIVDVVAAFSAAGTYVLRLTADDMKTSASDDVTVTVTAATSGTNLATGRPLTAYTASASASSSVSPDKAFDNNTGSYWYPGGSNGTGWVQVDLGQQVDIGRVEVVFRNDTGEDKRREFEIVASNDATFATFTTIAAQGNDAHPDAGLLWAAPVDTAGQTFRYVRYHKRHGFDAVVNEVRVFPKQTNPGGEAEVLTVTSKSGDLYEPLNDSGASGGQNVILRANAVGDFVTYSAGNFTGGQTYNVTVRVKRWPDRGQMKIYAQLDSNPNGTKFQQGNANGYDLSGTGGFIDLPAFTYTPSASGTRFFRFEVSGKNANSGQYWLAIDKITVVPVAAATSIAVPSPVTRQAETATRSGGPIDANHAGYNGTGFYNFGATGTSATFNDIGTGTAGPHTLAFRYANGGSSRTVNLTINGTTTKLTFAPTGSWSTWNTVSVAASLFASGNTIALASTGQDGGNLDELIVTAG